MKRIVLMSVGFLIAVAPVEAAVGPPGELNLRSEDGSLLLRVGGILQPRYEYENRESDATDHSSLSLQRARVDLSGHAYTDHLNYRVLTELAGTTNLLDGWIEYRRFTPYALRMGQFVVPFNRERDLGVGKLLGTERSIVNREFQWPTGRDVGLMVRRQRSGGLEYRAGVFGGQGRGARESSSNGMLAAGRLTYAFLGEYDRRESFPEPLNGVNLSAGLGSFYAHKNTVRRWFRGIGVPAATSDTANVAAGTLDLQLRSGRWNVSGSFVHREVAHHRGDAARFDGNGYTLEAGYLLVPEVLFVTGRHAQIYPNRSRTATRARSFVLNLHLFQKGNRSQARFETGVVRRRTGTGWDDDAFVRVQQQLAF